MNERYVFHDLVGPESAPNAADDGWLAAIARETDPDDLVVAVAASCAAAEPGPVLARDLQYGWRAGRYVGEIRRGGRVLEIRPRLGIQVLAEWASAALNLRVVPRAGEHHGSSVLIAELMAASWRTAVAEAARHGLPGFREDRQHISPYVRGRLSVSGTLRQRARGYPVAVSVDRPKALDNPVARSIVLADAVLDRRMNRPGWRGPRVEAILAQLRAATGPRPKLPSHRELERVRFTPITLAYRRAGLLSWQIARHQGLSSSAASDRSDGLLIDVAELWELFVVHCARRALGASEVVHGTHLRGGRPLLRNDEGRALGRLYPDLIIGSEAQPHAIVDAKYKPLAGRRGVDREDLYQLTTYLMAHPGQPMGMLAYPDLPDAEGPAREDALGPWWTPEAHAVRFVRLPLSEAACVARLTELLRPAG